MRPRPIRPRLLLASASPARLSTLRSAGLSPLVRVSDVDEGAVLAAARDRFGDLEPADAVLVLAQAKADDVARAIEDVADAHKADVLPDADDTEGAEGATGSDSSLEADLILGCDSMLELDGEAYGKPADAAQARERWLRMSGRSGILHTGHWVIDLRSPGNGGTGGTLGATSSTTVHFATVTPDEIDAYIASGEPLEVAGAFTIDGLGGPFISHIEGDHHGVVGVSLPLVRELLAELSIPLHTLWSEPEKM